MRHAKVGPFLSSLLLLGLTSCGGSEDPGTTEPDPPRAVSITVTQTSVTLSFVGATTALNASIRDQNGQLFSSTINWSSDDPAVVTVDAAGLLTAVQNGTATVTAASGSLSATVAVTVQQVATQLAIASGDGQSAAVGQALPEAPVVRAEDAGGATVAGVGLAFEVSSGGGSVGSATVVTDADGLASTSWTLGTTAGLQQIRVSIAGAPFAPIELSATGIAAAASALAKASGDLQVGPLSLALSAPIVVQLQDEFGNGVADGEVTFLVTGGGGSVSPAVATTGDDGTAQTTWTMGSVLGGATRDRDGLSPRGVHRDRRTGHAGPGGRGALGQPGRADVVADVHGHGARHQRGYRDDRNDLSGSTTRRWSGGGVEDDRPPASLGEHGRRIHGRSARRRGTGAQRGGGSDRYRRRIR